MKDINDFIVTNILSELSEAGEDSLTDDLSSFSCPHNQEIEHFIKANAIDFAKRKLSITYLVIDRHDAAIVAYFTLTHKAITIQQNGLSNTSKRRLASHSLYDPVDQSYSLSAFLLAQLGKNYTIENGNRISGQTLMILTYRVLKDIQNRIGGGVVYLDCDDNPFLTDFYESVAGYRYFGERISEIDNKRYLQFMRFL